MKIAHIINPCRVNETSDLFVAQPITFQTLIEAKRQAAPRVQVELFTTQFAGEQGLAPADFIATPDLERSIMDCGKFANPKKLPLIKDILDRLYTSSEADYFIYTNVDIGLQPGFYLNVAALIAEGYDAFTINRRTVSDRFKRVAEIPQILAEEGKRHGGHDCFVFPRSLYPKFRLGQICAGTGGIGRAMIYNLLCHGQRATLFPDKHLTFHIGDPRVWRNPKYRDMYDFNHGQCEQVLRQLQAEFGEFDHTRIGQNQLKTTSPARRWWRQLRSSGRRSLGTLRGRRIFGTHAN